MTQNIAPQTLYIENTRLADATMAGLDATNADKDGSMLVSVLVENGRISAVVPQSAAHTLDISADTERIDAEGQWIFPSLIDAHVHLREPGFEYKEDVASGLEAAAFGGFGAVMPMPNTKPTNDNAAITTQMLERARTAWPHGPRVYPVGAATKGLKGEELSAMKELQDAGCVAFSNDGRPVDSTEMFRRCMEYAADLDCRIIDHCEDSTLARGSHMNEGEVSGKIGIKGQATVAEALHVARDILLAEYLQIPVHLAHISCRQSLELIRFAKARGIAVSAETCPHYLILDESALLNYSTAAKVNPPLRTPDDVAAVREAIVDGTLDIFVTDHAPHSAQEKECTLDEAPNGISGLDSALALTWGFVREGLISVKDLLRLWCYTPAKLYNLPVNRFAVGDVADFFLFDDKMKWTLCRETMHSKSCNTPFLGQEMTGKVTAHWMGGNRIA